MRTLFLALLVSLSACFVGGHAEHAAARRGFTFLGDRVVQGGADHDAIGVGAADGRWHSMMIVVEDAPIELYDVVVTFGDGERFSPPTRLVFGTDSRSRVIDLPGNARFIRRVDFAYGNLVAGAQAKVELWAR